MRRHRLPVLSRRFIHILLHRFHRRRAQCLRPKLHFNRFHSPVLSHQRIHPHISRDVVPHRIHRIHRAHRPDQFRRNHTRISRPRFRSHRGHTRSRHYRRSPNRRSTLRLSAILLHNSHTLRRVHRSRVRRARRWNTRTALHISCAWRAHWFRHARRERWLRHIRRLLRRFRLHPLRKGRQIHVPRRAQPQHHQHSRYCRDLCPRSTSRRLVNPPWIVRVHHLLLRRFREIQIRLRQQRLERVVHLLGLRHHLSLRLGGPHQFIHRGFPLIRFSPSPRNLSRLLLQR